LVAAEAAGEAQLVDAGSRSARPAGGWHSDTLIGRRTGAERTVSRALIHRL
jgi:hypothetical protein